TPPRIGGRVVEPHTARRADESSPRAQLSLGRTQDSRTHVARGARTHVASAACVARPGGLLAIPALDDSGSLHVVVESPRGSTCKFKYDPGLAALTLARPLPQGLVYPHDWGFVPSTKAPDGDPFDARIVWDGISHPGVVVTCRAVGVLLVEQT